MEPHLWSDLNWFFLISLVLGSGLFAYLGDVLGTKIGKKRISILGLRPRHTSSIITAITGVAITIVVLVSLSITSDTVRTTLFSMKFLQRQITQLTSELQDSRDESELTYLQLVETQDKLESQEKKLKTVGDQLTKSTSQLEQNQKELAALKVEKQKLDKTISNLSLEAEQLKKGLTQVRGGRIIVFADELLAQNAVEAGTQQEAVRSILNRMVQRAEFFVAARLRIDPAKMNIDIDNEQIDKALAETVLAPERKFIRLLAGSNILAGESLKVKFEIRDSRLIYDENVLLLSDHVDSPSSESEAESILHGLLRKLNSKAVQDGVLPNPIDGTIGILDGSDFFDAVDKLVAYNGSVDIDIYTKEKVYTEGPVRVKIKLGNS